MTERFEIIQCESAPELSIVWDRVEQCVIDVIDSSEPKFEARFSPEELLAEM